MVTAEVLSGLKLKWAKAVACLKFSGHILLGTLQWFQISLKVALTCTVRKSV